MLGWLTRACSSKAVTLAVEVSALPLFGKPASGIGQPKLTSPEPARINCALTRRLLLLASMKDKTVAILESRVRDHIASLVRKHGGTPFLAPALAEIPDVDPAHVQELIRDWDSMPPDIFIFQTGVGTRALFSATDSLRLTSVLLRILDRAQVIVRGPKPAMVLRSHKVRIDRAASDPFTTHEVLAEMHETSLRGKRVVVQRYGRTNRELQAALESAGAEVIEIVTYRWALPEDTAPLLRLIDALGRDEINLVAFTSASQATNLFAVARDAGKEASLKQSLGRTLVASIGPVCSAALRMLAVRVDIEAKPPKLGPFIDAINMALSDSHRLGKS
jgi:uroporphyrinogen-III synthase